MRTKRDRRQTPKGTSLALGSQAFIEDAWLSDAVPPDGTDYGDTASVKVDSTVSANKSTLNGEGTLKDTVRVIPKEISSKFNKSRKNARNNYRVPVLNPDGILAMPTTSRRANKWIKKGKATRIANKLGIFQVQLINEPSGRNKQPIALSVDPGSAFTGIGVISKKAVLYGIALELPGYKKGSKPAIVTNRFGKKIEKYPNGVVEGMDKRRQLRRSRRYRKTRRRPERWLNRTKTKIAPSILARKQLELKVVTELSKIYPINIIGFEDIKFNHFKDKEGTKGQFFSHVEVGKNWILKELQKLVNSPVRIIRGYETNIRREQLGLAKEKDKTMRSVDSHVNDCIAMGSIILGLGIDIGNKFKFDTITRPKYSRRILHLEQFSKGGVRRRYGGSTIPFSKLRKGDYVEAIQREKVFRGWVSGYTHMHDSDYIYMSDFDWKGFGKNGMQTAVVPSNIRLLSRSSGLLLKSMENSMTREEHFDKISGTRQIGIEDAWRF